MEAMRCTICQKFLPKTARKGTRFCGTNCRSRAYRLRQQHPETPTGGRVSATQKMGSQPKAKPSRRQAANPLTIPAVLEHMQQVRERAGVRALTTDPMLSYQANLDALLSEHMATRRVLATHVTNAEQVVLKNASVLSDPSLTQVGIGVVPTARGDSSSLSYWVRLSSKLPRWRSRTPASPSPSHRVHTWRNSGQASRTMRLAWRMLAALDRTGLG
jgi:hypothetical protein